MMSYRAESMNSKRTDAWKEKKLKHLLLCFIEIYKG